MRTSTRALSIGIALVVGLVACASATGSRRTQVTSPMPHPTSAVAAHRAAAATSPPVPGPSRTGNDCTGLADYQSVLQLVESGLAFLLVRATVVGAPTFTGPNLGTVPVADVRILAGRAK